MIDRIVDDVFLSKVGNKTLFIIRRRTKRGEFLPGSSSGAGDYSKNPFAMPLGAANKTLGGRIKKASGNKGKYRDPENFQLFQTKANALWVLVKGGYSGLRKLAGKQNDNVTMNWSGSYLRDLGVLRTESDNIILGWKSREIQQLAYWHEVSGAGKSRRIHKILGITKAEGKELLPLVEKEFLKRVDNYFKEYLKKESISVS